ncbi:ferritin light chain [Tribolium castaneum]|uniref:Ferritin n=1 Tax=Tribolium castaneum TaxID=7070 RepID=D6WA31_TRICA|nr:PREDICTED: ferritin heavy chain [Tribolium castaneum]XP_975766.1 PREDICTED: ferritin heavy chain [Tribolium castaneum]EEZ98578.1 Ferritin light chain-like Protein [Tribolium castaneum]|eukprot:XP_966312.1 PREDICTED: ferritin heavy chain [Tribolium castaneum]
MKVFAVVVAFLVAVATAHESCYSQVDQACSKINSKPGLDQELIPCNATYGHINIVTKDLINFANTHIVRSFEYLLMATHYGNYQMNRAGFEKLFRGLSDEKWHEAIELIEQITTRGGVMEFVPPKALNGVEKTNNVYQLYEIQSVAKALDMEKKLALEAFNIHKEASGRSEGKHDPEISSYIEKEFVHDHAKTIRKLAGYVTDLKSILSGPDGSLGLFLFDEYLQKQ